MFSSLKKTQRHALLGALAMLALSLGAEAMARPNEDPMARLYTQEYRSVCRGELETGTPCLGSLEAYAAARKAQIAEERAKQKEQQAAQREAEKARVAENDKAWREARYNEAVAAVDAAIAHYAKVAIEYHQKQLDYFSRGDCSQETMKMFQKDDDVVVPARLDMQHRARAAAMHDYFKAPSSKPADGLDLLSARQALNPDYAEARTLAKEVDTALRACFKSGPAHQAYLHLQRVNEERLKLLEISRIAEAAVSRVEQGTMFCPIGVNALDSAKARLNIWDKASSPYANEERIVVALAEARAAVQKAAAYLPARCGTSTNGEAVIAEMEREIQDCDGYADYLEGIEEKNAQNPRRRAHARVNLYCMEPGWHRKR